MLYNNICHSLVMNNVSVPFKNKSQRVGDLESVQATRTIKGKEKAL